MMSDFGDAMDCRIAEIVEYRTHLKPKDSMLNDKNEEGISCHSPEAKRRMYEEILNDLVMELLPYRKG